MTQNVVKASLVFLLSTFLLEGRKRFKRSWHIENMGGGEWKTELSGCLKSSVTEEEQLYYKNLERKCILIPILDLADLTSSDILHRKGCFKTQFSDSPDRETGL